jgi:hypothetical protein
MSRHGDDYYLLEGAHTYIRLSSENCARRSFERYVSVLAMQGSLYALPSPEMTSWENPVCIDEVSHDSSVKESQL